MDCTQKTVDGNSKNQNYLTQMNLDMRYTKGEGDIFNLRIKFEKSFKLSTKCERKYTLKEI